MRKKSLCLVALMVITVLSASLSPWVAKPSLVALSNPTVSVYVVGYNHNAGKTVALAGVPVRLQGDGCVNPGNVFSDTVITDGQGRATFICGSGATYSIRTDANGKLGQYHFYSSTPITVTTAVGSPAHMSAYVHVPDPVISSFTATIANGITTLNWQTANASVCLASWAGNGTVILSGKASTDTTTPTVYTLRCSNLLDMWTTSSVTSTQPTAPTPTPNNPTSGSRSGTTTINTATTKTAGSAGPKSVAPVTATISATSGDMTPPTAPTNFTAVPSSENKSVQLSWSAATDNIAVTGYLLERSTDAENWKTINNDSATGFTDENISSDIPYYYYRLRAQDAAGNLSEATSSNFETSSFSRDNSFVTKEAVVASEENSNNFIVVAKLFGLIALIIAVLTGITYFRNKQVFTYRFNRMKSQFVSAVNRLLNR